MAKNLICREHFTNDPKTLPETWQKLFGLGIEEIYPSHGKPFNTGWKSVIVQSSLTRFD